MPHPALLAMNNSLIIVLRNFMNRDAGQARLTAGLTTAAQLTGKRTEEATRTCFLPWVSVGGKARQCRSPGHETSMCLIQPSAAICIIALRYLPHSHNKFAFRVVSYLRSACGPAVGHLDLGLIALAYHPLMSMWLRHSVHRS